MPVNRVAKIPQSMFPGAKKGRFDQMPEIDYTMTCLRKGLNGECLELIILPEDILPLAVGIKHPVTAFVHHLEQLIKAEKLNYVVRQRNIDGKDKYPRIYVMSGYVDYLAEKKRTPKKLVTAADIEGK